MSGANKEVSHVVVLPEDRANTQIVSGFVLHHAVDSRKIQIAREAGGWREVLNRFEDTYVAYLSKHPAAFMVLLMDFDSYENRLVEAREKIPAHLIERVFILGSRTKPEDLRKKFRKSFEEIGKTLARECESNISKFWADELLKINESELIRLRIAVCRFVFK